MNVAIFASVARITITQSHTHTMQQTHMRKAENGHVKAKKLFSPRRQSNYSVFCCCVLHDNCNESNALLGCYEDTEVFF